jgi:hypothetical protein
VQCGVAVVGKELLLFVFLMRLIVAVAVVFTITIITSTRAVTATCASAAAMRMSQLYNATLQQASYGAQVIKPAKSIFTTTIIITSSHHHIISIIKSSPHQSTGIQTLSRAAPTSCGASTSSCDAMVIPRPEDQMVRFQPLHTPLYSNSSWGMVQTSCVFVLSFCFIFFEGVWFGRLTIRAGVSSHGKRQLEAKEAVISEMCNGAGAGGADDDLNACENQLKPHSKILYSFAR